MTLSDKTELLFAKQLELKEKEEKLPELRQSIKSALIDSEEFSNLEKDVVTISEAIKLLENEIDRLDNEVRMEEKSLQDIAKKAAKQKEEKMRGVNKLEYLKTKESVLDFAKLLQKTGGDSENSRDFTKAWKDHLCTKGITNPDILLPQSLITSITDALEASGTIYSTFNFTNLTMWRTALNTNIGDGETARAKGHKRGTVKEEESITLADKIIRAQYIFKYITLDKETLRENSDTGALLSYVLSELPQRIVREIERAALIGDGRSAAADNKINSYEAILRTTADTYVSVQAQASATSLLADLVNMDATITAPGPRYLVTSRATLASLKLTENNGGLVFPIGTDISSALGYAGIFTPDWWPAAGASNPVAIEYVGPSYKVVGDQNMDSFENFILKQNQNEYMMEIYSGGALDTPKSGAVLMPYVAS
jgi:HK97 family phage major capsid protein